MRAAEICTSLIFCSFLTTASEGGLGMGAGWQQSPCGACDAATGAGAWNTYNRMAVANGHTYVTLQTAAHYALDSFRARQDTNEQGVIMASAESRLHEAHHITQHSSSAG